MQGKEIKTVGLQTASLVCWNTCGPHSRPVFPPPHPPPTVLTPRLDTSVAEVCRLDKQTEEPHYEHE